MARTQDELTWLDVFEARAALEHRLSTIWPHRREPWVRRWIRDVVSAIRAMRALARRTP